MSEGAKGLRSGLPLAKVNPRQARRFAEAIGTLAKADRVEAAMGTPIKEDEALAGRSAILPSIPGIAELSAFAMLIDMPELAAIVAEQAAALAGLAPITRQSGTWKGRAAIRGGGANPRQAFYMPALVATRFNEDLKAKYQELIQAGNPARIAITAVMRKLLLLASALLRDRRKWTPKNA